MIIPQSALPCGEEDRLHFRADRCSTSRPLIWLAVPAVKAREPAVPTVKCTPGWAHKQGDRIVGRPRRPDREPRGEVPTGHAAQASDLDNGILAQGENGNVVFCQLAPWQFEAKQPMNVKHT